MTITAQSLFDFRDAEWKREGVLNVDSLDETTIKIREEGWFEALKLFFNKIKNEGEFLEQKLVTVYDDITMMPVESDSAEFPPFVSTMAIIKEEVTSRPNQRTTISSWMEHCDLYSAGTLDERFYLGDFLKTAVGTAFAVSPRHALTAKHNVFGGRLNCNSATVNPQASNLRLANYLDSEGNELLRSYRFSVIEKSSRADWALLELADDEPDFASWLDIDTKKVPTGFYQDAPVYCTGHPLGASQHLHFSATVRWDCNDQLFKADLDTFRGNSGSPVLCATTDKVVGLLVRGESDFILKKGIWKVNSYCNAPRWRAEEVLKLSTLSRTAIKTINKAKEQ